MRFNPLPFAFLAISVTAGDIAVTVTDQQREPVAELVLWIARQVGRAIEEFGAVGRHVAENPHRETTGLTVSVVRRVVENGRSRDVETRGEKRATYGGRYGGFPISRVF
jgi:hypothetical protein